MRTLSQLSFALLLLLALSILIQTAGPARRELAIESSLRRPLARMAPVALLTDRQAATALVRLPARIITPRQGNPGDQQSLTAVRVPLPLDGSGPQLRGELLLRTARLDIYLGVASLSPDQVQQIAPVIERYLSESERAFYTRLPQRVSLGIYRPRAAPIRGIRGIAYTDSQRAEIFYAPGERLDSAIAVAVHELGHHLQVARYGLEVQRRADTILHEGLATWIAGRPWLERSGAASWHQRAQQLYASGVPLRLISAERSGSDAAYDLWASFVDYLLAAYGWERFDAIYSSGRGRVTGSADYIGVYGKPLADLTEEWRAWVLR